MTSKTSSKQWIVLKSALKRLKWLAILYGVVLLLDLPLSLWLNLSAQKALQGNQWIDVANNLYLPQMFAHPIAMLANIAVPIVFGLILFYYLQSERASTFFHSLPLKREFLYLQNLLAGLVLIWLPVLVSGLAMYGVFTSFGITQGQWYQVLTQNPVMGIVQGSSANIVPLGQIFTCWLLLNLIMTGFFYVFTVFVGMFTGNVLLQGVLTLIGLVLPLGVYGLIQFNLWKLLYGYPRNFDQVFEWLSPLVVYFDANASLSPERWTWYLGYLAAAVVFCGLSVYLYKARQAEAAGETLAAPWIRQVFKYGVATCAALTGGLYFSTFYAYSAWVLYLGYLVGAVLGYIIADMIAYKSFRFYERWKGILVFGAVFILLLASVKLDVYGYEKYVPAQEEVKGVTLSLLNREGATGSDMLTAEENIAKVLQLHRQIIALKDENKAQVESVRPGNIPPNTLMPVDLIYTLENGKKIRRTYTIDILRYRDLLRPIITSEEAKRIMYAQLFKLDESEVNQIVINNFHLEKNIRIYNPAEIAEAVAALRKDVLNTTYEALMEGKVAAKANIEFATRTNMQDNYNFYNLTYYSEYKNFERFLSEHGYYGNLFLAPEEVDKIIVYEMGTDRNSEVTAKQDIMVLLDWCSLQDEKAFMSMKEMEIQRGKGVPGYYGKLVKRDGSTMYIVFDGNPYVSQVINDLLSSR